MRFAVALVLLALAPTAAASGLVRDATGDVERVDDLGVVPSSREDIDLRTVAVTRGAEDGRVTLGFGATLPVDLELTVVLQLGAQAERVAVVHVWRSAGDQWPDATLSHAMPDGAAAVATVRAAFAEDAVQLVLPASAFATEPCFALRSVRSSHLGEDGARYLDALDVDPACTTPSVAGAQSVLSTDGRERASEEAYDLPSDARVPAPGIFALLMALGCAARGVAAFSRRR